MYDPMASIVNLCGEVWWTVAVSGSFSLQLYDTAPYCPEIWNSLSNKGPIPIWFTWQLIVLYEISVLLKPNPWKYWSFLFLSAYYFICSDARARWNPAEQDPHPFPSSPLQQILPKFLRVGDFLPVLGDIQFSTDRALYKVAIFGEFVHHQ